MKLLLNSDLFEYDIRGLLMAFCPWTDFSTEETAEDTQCLRVFYGEERNGKLSADVTFTDGDRTFRTEAELDLSDRKTAKTLLKQKLYRLLSEATGKTLPWGTLTGIRPTKIPMAMIREGASEEEIRHHMEDELLCSHEKSVLAEEIARRELRLLNTIDAENGYSLYIGIPFCPSICLYCSFSSYALDAYKDRVDDYLAALLKELSYAEEAFRGKPLNSIYFGGGTPTTLTPVQLDMLLGEVTKRFDLSAVREWTVEAGRPDSVTREKLQVLRQYPVSRISVNPQTMHQKTLDLIGRKHTVEDVIHTYDLAREMGFDNINMDLILGLPGEDKKDVEETMQEIVKLDPDNVTIHSLAIKRAARLNLFKDAYADYRMENSDELMNLCGQYLKTIGQKPYYLYRQKNMAGNQENVGYAREGKEGVYNILIMEEVQTILALGAGATTKRVQKDLITRAENVKDVRTYIANIDEMIERKKTLFRA